MPRLPIRVLLFVSSYAPLLGLLAYRSRDVRGAVLILGGLALLSSLGLMILMLSYINSEGAPLAVKRVVPRDTEVLGYIASYLIPFFGVDLGQKDDVITLVGFLAILCVIYINSSLLLVNPLLSLFGFRVWAVTDRDEHEYLLVSRRPPALGQTIRPTKVGEYLRVEVSWHKAQASQRTTQEPPSKS